MMDRYAELDRIKKEAEDKQKMQQETMAGETSGKHG